LNYLKEKLHNIIQKIFNRKQRKPVKNDVKNAKNKKRLSDGYPEPFLTHVKGYRYF